MDMFREVPRRFGIAEARSTFLNCTQDFLKLTSHFAVETALKDKVIS